MKLLSKTNRPSQRILHFCGLIAGAMLVLMSALPMMGSDGTTELSTGEWIEANRLRVQARADNYENAAQNRMLTIGDDTYFLVITKQDTGYSSRVCNLYQVFIPDAANNKKAEYFAGQTTYGPADLLAASDGTMYVVSGASSWNYFGRGGEEFAEGEVHRYDPDGNMNQKVRTAFRYSFGEGTGNVFRKACLDEASGKIYLFYTSEEGTQLSWLTYDVAGRKWEGIRSFRTEIALNGLHVFAAGGGQLLVVGQPMNGEAFLLLRITGADGETPEIVQKRQPTGQTADVTVRGDAYLDMDHHLHVLAGTPDGGNVTHYLYTDTLEAVGEPVSLPLGSQELQIMQMEDRTIAVFAASIEEGGITVTAYTSASDTLSDLRLAATYVTKSGKMITPGSFQISSFPSGTERGKEIGLVFNGSDYSFLLIKLGK